MTDELIERVATIFLAAFYPHLTSRMEGPFNAANSTQRRIAKDAAQAALAALKPGDTWNDLYVEQVYETECANHPDPDFSLFTPLNGYESITGYEDSPSLTDTVLPGYAPRYKKEDYQ